jgi:hypothetical protein
MPPVMGAGGLCYGPVPGDSPLEHRGGGRDTSLLYCFYGDFAMAISGRHSGIGRHSEKRTSPRGGGPGGKGLDAASPVVTLMCLAGSGFSAIKAVFWSIMLLTEPAGLGLPSTG